MREVLQAVQRAFTEIVPNGHRNPEAAELYRQNPQEFRLRVTMDILNTTHDLTNDTGLNNSQMNFG